MRLLDFSVLGIGACGGLLGLTCGHPRTSVSVPLLPSQPPSKQRRARLATLRPQPPHLV
ncbi:MAG TPA: hypothetical protein VKM94_05680 [Blastocatellia bacterium]|nr:hypothetical protein [Blastocatellia bacterium]